MCHNIVTSYMNFGYDVFSQSYPNTMHILYIQASQVDSINLIPFEMNITPTENPSTNR